MTKNEQVIPTDYLRTCFVYDATNGILVWLHRPRDHFRSNHEFLRWNTRYAGTVAGSSGTDGYQLVAIRKMRGFLVHRIVWAMHAGTWPVNEIDHIDGDPSNNRIGNLRCATHLQNVWNRTKPHPNNTSGYRGVTRNGGKWVAQVKLNGKMVKSGSFTNVEDAARAAKAKRQELYGEFCGI